jgi:branched-chain amino acid transport system substrate-binding protein
VGTADFVNANPLAVRIYANARNGAASEVAIARQLSKSRAAFVSLEDEFSLALKAEARAAFLAGGGQSVFEDTLLPQETDFGVVIEKLRQANPEIIFAYPLAKSGLFFRKLAEAKLNLPVITNYWIQSTDQAEAAGAEALSRVMLTEVNSDKPHFRSRFEETFPGGHYNPAAYLCYVAVGALLQAAKQPGAFADEESLRQALTNVARVTLLDGDISFQEREIQFDLVAKKFLGFKAVPLN